MRKTLALFDFDGTITREDTLFAVIRFICGKRKLYSGMIALSPFLCLYLVKVISNGRMKERVLRRFFGGMPKDLFQERCEAFCRDSLPGLLRRDALAEIKKHQREGAEIMVVTASAEDWVAPWCRREGIACLGTRLQVRGGNITGKIAGENCNGPEKVRRIRAAVDLSAYDQVIAYGDTGNDRPMLRLADEPHYKVFHR